MRSCRPADLYAATVSVRLTKTHFVLGLRCPRLLWWTVHDADGDPSSIPPDAAARLAWGRRVGEAARVAFPGGVAIDARREATRGAVEATMEAVQGGAPRIYEAAFEHGGVFVAVDILERSRPGWRLREVKSSTRMKPEHVPDAAVQAWVAHAAGLELDAVEIAHLDRDCVYPDLSNLFRTEDVTEAVGREVPGVAREVRRLQHVLAGELPTVATGEHCHAPYPCPYLARCWEPQASDHLSTLYYGGRRARELLRAGIERIRDIPPSIELTGVQDRQRRAVCGDCVVVDDGLDEALAAFDGPHAYLDFETISPAIPQWAGCRPYDQVPVQFAFARADGEGALDWIEHLAAAGEDPRPALARALVAACEGAGTILAWNASFEQRCVEALMETVPEEASGLEQVWDKLEDLLPVVREHVYAPAFGGSFSLKRVLPALLPHLAYDDLEIQGGGVASMELEQLLLRPAEVDPEDAARLRPALLAYCRRDVEGLAALHAWLAEQAG